MFYVGAISNERRYRKQPKKTINFEHLKVQVFIYIYICILLYTTYTCFKYDTARVVQYESGQTWVYIPDWDDRIVHRRTIFP